MALSNLGDVARKQGAYDRARSLTEESLAIQRELGAAWAQAHVLTQLARIVLAQGDDALASDLFREALQLCREANYMSVVPWCLEECARIALAHAEPERAARLFAVAARLREAINVPIPPADRPDHEAALAAVRTALGPAAFAAAWAAGTVMTAEAALAFAPAQASPDHPQAARIA